MAVKQNPQVLIPSLDAGIAADPGRVATWWASVKFSLDQVFPQLLGNVNELIGGNVSQLQFQKLPAAPKGAAAGMVAYADGTNWNPGAGEGLYEYRSDAAWHKL